MRKMRSKHLTKSVTEKEELGCIETTWLNWCRLCAKREETDQENSSIFVKNESGKPDSELATAIGKYFWVNIKAEDEISKRLCVECRKLIEELICFTERVNKVQTMYVLLQNLKPTSSSHANKLRSQCGLIDEGWEHIIKPTKPNEVEIPKPQLQERETQTDLMIYFNNGLGEDKKTPKFSLDTEKLRKEIVEDLEKQLQDDDNDHLPTEEIDSEQTYEYVLQDDDQLVYIENTEIQLQDSKPKIIDLAVDEEGLELREEVEVGDVNEEEEEVHDSDLFKELKFKIEDDDDHRVGKKFKFSSDQEEIELEYQESGETLNAQDFDNMEEEALEELDDDDEDGKDYVNISESSKTQEFQNNALNLLLKQKRGRPTMSGKKTSVSVYRYECKECKRKYKNPNIYRKHMQSMHNVVIEKLPDFMCSHCQKDCLTESRLKMHMRLHLSQEEKLTVPCPYCDRKFSQVGAMRQHVNGIHHQMKPFICDQCGRACKTMAALNEHQLVHTTECPFECDVCHKRFKNKPRLKSHMDTHTKSVYACPDCGLELNTKRTLLQHRLVHSDVKRFKCEFCDAAFKRSKALKNHLILHTGLRPYKCNFCDRSFSNGSNCRAHKKRAHPTELAEEEAKGIVTEPVAVPKLEDLKSAKGVLVQPRKIKRHAGGLPDHLRKLLLAAEKRKKQNFDDDSEDNPNMGNCDYSDMHYEIGEIEMEEECFEDQQDLGEECEETVIYEIIDEI